MKNYNTEIRKLQEISALNKSEFLEMDTYCKYPNQKVSICMHPASRFGAYHVHDFFEINYVYTGKCLNFIDGKTITMEQGSLVLMNAGTFHTVYSFNDSIIYNILLRKSWFTETLCHYSLPESPAGKFISASKKPSYFKYLFYSSVPSDIKETLEELFANKESNPLLIESITLKLFVQFLELEKGRLSEVRGSADDIMLRILSHISTNYSTVTLDSLSKTFGYSPTHICRLFNKNIGKIINKILCVFHCIICR